MTASRIASTALPASQRIDKWLWCARFFKTRSLAAKTVSEGGFRLTREGATSRIEKASALIRPGDKVAFLLGERLRVLEIVACGLRRGPAAEARLLYEDCSPPAPDKDGPRREKRSEMAITEKN